MGIGCWFKSSYFLQAWDNMGKWNWELVGSPSVGGVGEGAFIWLTAILKTPGIYFLRERRRQVVRRKKKKKIINTYPMTRASREKKNETEICPDC